MAPAMARLEASSTSVLNPVTRLGSRGCSGGGHSGAARRSTKKPETRPAKNITSAAMRNTIASRTLSSGRRGEGSRSSPSPPPVGGGGGGVRPFVFRLAGGRGGASRTSRLTSESPPGARPRRARPRSSAARAAADGCARRGRSSACSCLVEGQQRQQQRQIEERGQQHAARVRERGGQRLLRPHRHEGRAQDE